MDHEGTSQSEGPTVRHRRGNRTTDRTLLPTPAPLRYPDRARRKSEGPGTFLTENPGPSASRYPGKGVAALPLCQRCTALSSPIGDCAGRCSKTLLGSTTAGAAVSQCGSAAAATVATPTARGRAPRSADASRCTAPGLATSRATAAPVGTRLARAPGVRVEHRK